LYSVPGAILGALVAVLSTIGGGEGVSSNTLTVGSAGVEVLPAKPAGRLHAANIITAAASITTLFMRFLLNTFIIARKQQKRADDFSSALDFGSKIFA